MPDTIKILTGLKSRYEAHHGVKFSSAAIKTAVELSARYINDRKLPDKAIDVIDESAAAQNLLAPSRRRQIIGQKEIEATIATMARIPSKHVSRDDKQALASLETDLKRMVFGQDKAITALASAIKLSCRDCASQRSQLAIIYSLVQRVLVRQKWQNSSLKP